MLARTRQLVAVTAAVASAAAAAACHNGARRAVGPAGGPAVVFFTNESLEQADVYVVPQGNSRMRIGTVLPGRTDTLRVQPAQLGGAGTVTIAASLLASSRVPNTGPLTLAGGDRIAVRLTSDARTLSVLPAP